MFVNRGMHIFVFCNCLLMERAVAPTATIKKFAVTRRLKSYSLNSCGMQGHNGEKPLPAITAAPNTVHVTASGTIIGGCLCTLIDHRCCTYSIKCVGSPSSKAIQGTKARSMLCMEVLSCSKREPGSGQRALDKVR